MEPGLHKPYEQIIAGYYKFGPLYHVNLDKNLRHNIFTEIHERVHINLGSSTNLGYFHQFWNYLATGVEYRIKPSFIDPVFELAIESARNVHEATATFVEFTQAKDAAYPGLDQMLRQLPKKYKAWKEIYENFFDKRIPLLAQALLSEHISRLVLDINILTEFSKPSENMEQSFREYIAKPMNSPDDRLKKIMKIIAGNDQLKIFSTYLKIFSFHEKEIYQRYSVRSRENRMYTFRMQGELREAFREGLSSLFDDFPEFKRWLSDSKVKTDQANNFSRNWCEFLIADGYTEKCKFRIVNTDDAPVDVIDNRLLVRPASKPKSKLYLIQNISMLPRQRKYFGRVWIHSSGEPFLLSSTPLRYLNKGDIYIRLNPVNDSGTAFFIVTKDKGHLNQLLDRKDFDVIFDGKDYKFIQKMLNEDRATFNATCIYFWKYIEEINGDIGAGEIEICTISVAALNADVTLFCGDPGSYHLLFSTKGSGTTLAVHEITNKAKKVSPLMFENRGQLRQTLETALKFGNTTF